MNSVNFPKNQKSLAGEVLYGVASCGGAIVRAGHAHKTTNKIQEILSKDKIHMCIHFQCDIVIIYT